MLCESGPRNVPESDQIRSLTCSVSEDGADASRSRRIAMKISADDQAADRGGEQHDAGHLEHPEDDVDADVLRRRRLLDDVDDDRFLLKEEHRYLQLTTHASASSASSASVRTPTPVAPFG